jgi:hypothetical protein
MIQNLIFKTFNQESEAAMKTARLSKTKSFIEAALFYNAGDVRTAVYHSNVTSLLIINLQENIIFYEIRNGRVRGVTLDDAVCVRARACGVDRQKQ